LFIAFIGLQDAKIVVLNSSTCVSMNTFNFLGNATWASVMPMLVTIAAVLDIAVLSKKKVKGAVIIGILGGTVVYYLLGLTIPDFYKDFLSGISMNPISAFKDFANLSFGKVITEGFDFSGYLANHNTTELVLVFATTALAFCMVDMFDTMGTLYGACKSGDMLIKKEDGEEEIPNMNEAMLADAIATCTGAVCGTSTVTTYVESSAGCAAGGKTGLAALVTGGMFVIAMFLSPVAALVPACAYAAALIYVGILMMGCVKDIQWDNPSVAVPSFLTLVMMPFTYNISYGIAFGLLSHIVIKVFTGKIKEVKIATWVITLLFVAMFFFTH